MITDGVLVPDAEDPHHVERVVRLASGAVTYEPPDGFPATPPPRRAKGDAVTLMSFAQPEQVGDPCLDLWAPVLRALPSARLVLMGPRWGQASVTTAVADGFRKRGIDPRRIIMSEATRGDLTTHLLSRADVVLDSTPESVSLGTLQALAMGVPVVTLPGRSVAGRHAAAHLTHADLPQGIATSPDDYVDRVERALRTPRFPVRLDCDAWVRDFTMALDTAFDEIAADSLADADEDAL
jgi:predicted O-linked N-acetylglucosamine transferase (SPINDLY family)